MGSLRHDSRYSAIDISVWLLASNDRAKALNRESLYMIPSKVSVPALVGSSDRAVEVLPFQHVSKLAIREQDIKAAGRNMGRLCWSSFTSHHRAPFPWDVDPWNLYIVARCRDGSGGIMATRCILLLSRVGAAYSLAVTTNRASRWLRSPPVPIRPDRW